MTYHVLYLPDCLAIARRPHAFVNKTKPDTTGVNHMTKIAQFAEYGDSDVLRVIDAPAPTAGPGQVRVAVRAAGVNPIDAKTVEGLMRNVIPLTLPAGVGTDVSGVIDQVGPGVSEFAVGDEVLGSSVTPSFAEYALAEPASLVRKPHDIPWEVAGSLAGAGGTAYAVLKKLRLKAGETLLIHGIQRVGGIHILRGRYRDTAAAENQRLTVLQQRICGVNIGELYRAALNIRYRWRHRRNSDQAGTSNGDTHGERRDRRIWWTDRRFSSSATAEGWPRGRVQFRDGNRHSRSVGRAQ